MGHQAPEERHVHLRFLQRVLPQQQLGVGPEQGPPVPDCAGRLLKTAFFDIDILEKKVEKNLTEFVIDLRRRMAVGEVEDDRSEREEAP